MTTSVKTITRKASTHGRKLWAEKLEVETLLSNKDFNEKWLKEKTTFNEKKMFLIQELKNKDFLDFVQIQKDWIAKCNSFSKKTKTFNQSIFINASDIIWAIKYLYFKEGIFFNIRLNKDKSNFTLKIVDFVENFYSLYKNEIIES